MTTTLSHPSLGRLPGIAHGFYTRHDGVSDGIYESLNCGLGSRDEPELVQENRARVATALGVPAGALATPYQVHGTQVTYAESAWRSEHGPESDAVVTDRPGIALGVSTADCGPILFADQEAQVVGAAHAGWRGALSGVLAATVDAMERRRADRSRIVAVLGPTISQANYEVGGELMDRFTGADRANERYFRPSDRDGHAMFDLPGYIVSRLADTGVAQVSALNLCTYADPGRFFSYRRATHRGQADYGRMLSVIALTP